MDSIYIQPRTPRDDPRIVEIIHAIHPDRPPISVEEYRHDLSSTPERAGYEHVVAERSGELIGFAAWSQRWYSSEEDSFMLHVTVDPRHWGQGTGSALYERGMEGLRERNARKIFTQLREDRPESMEFARKRGFEPTGFSDRMSRLEVRSAKLDRCREAARRVEESGIRITTMAGLNPDEAMLRAICELDNATARDVPSSEEWKVIPFEEWRKLFLETPGYRAEAFWVAFDGERPVGFAYLEMRQGNMADNGYTCTAPTHRGRGIARALKLETVEWAQSQGIEYIVTGNDVHNKPMLAINIDLGYQPLPARVEMVMEVLSLESGVRRGSSIGSR